MPDVDPVRDIDAAGGKQSDDQVAQEDREVAGQGRHEQYIRLRRDVRSRELRNSAEGCLDQVNGLNGYGYDAVLGGDAGYAEVPASRLVSSCEEQAFRCYAHKLMAMHAPNPPFA